MEMLMEGDEEGKERGREMRGERSDEGCVYRFAGVLRSG